MPWTRDEMAARAAQELRDGMYVNLGIGLPTRVADFVPNGLKVYFESENGLLGLGPSPTVDEVDPDLQNAGGETTTFIPGASAFSSADGFAMIRGGHIDLAILGGLEVSETGDLANWTVPGQFVSGMGGAMDLVVGARRVVVLMDHLNKRGEPKLRRETRLPLTGQRVVSRVVTDLGVLDVTPQGFRLVERAPGVTLEDLRARTDAAVLLP